MFDRCLFEGNEAKGAATHSVYSGAGQVRLSWEHIGVELPLPYVARFKSIPFGFRRRRVGTASLAAPGTSVGLTCSFLALLFFG